jgi:hypothetical protein
MTLLLNHSDDYCLKTYKRMNYDLNVFRIYFITLRDIHAVVFSADFDIDSHSSVNYQFDRTKN